MTTGWIIVIGVLVVGILGAVFALTRRKNTGQESAVWGHLVTVSGNEPRQEFALSGNQIEVGRIAATKDGIAFFQEDISVSRVQGIVSKKGSQVFFENRSVNGTIVNGQVVTDSESIELMPGTAIEMGKHKAVVFYRPIGSNVEYIPARMPQDFSRIGQDTNHTVMDTNRTVIDTDKTVHNADRTVQQMERAAQNIDRTVIVSNSPVENVDKTVIASSRPVENVDRTVIAKDGPEQEFDKTVMAVDRTVMAPPPDTNEKQ